MGGVQVTYLRYEAAGDMHVGRTVCGLPNDKPKFAILPPFFERRDDFLRLAIATCYPTLPDSAVYIGEFALASVVFHADYLRATLPPRHPLFSTRLFCEKDMLHTLQQQVTCRLAKDDDLIRPSGIPPHISLVSSMSTIASDIKAIIPAVSSVIPKVVNGVAQVLEDRAIESGSITRSGLEQIMTTCLNKAVVRELLQRLQSADNVEANSDCTTSSSRTQYSTFTWGERLHPVPEDYALPNGGMLQAWQHWCLGDTAKQIAPLRQLKSHDFPTINARKRLCDFRHIMLHIEKTVRDRGAWIKRPSAEDANNMYRAAQVHLAITADRPGQIKWRTACNLLRQSERSSREQSGRAQGTACPSFLP